MADSSWAPDDDWLREGACVAVAVGVPLAELLEAVDADPAPVSPADRVEATVSVAALPGGATLLVDTLSAALADEDVVARASRAGRLGVFNWTVNLATWLLVADAGRLEVSFDPTAVPEEEWAALAAEHAWLPPFVGDDDDSVEMGLRLLEAATGVPWSRGDLERTVLYPLRSGPEDWFGEV